jgi:hypothetical protein
MAGASGGSDFGGVGERTVVDVLSFLPGHGTDVVFKE